MTKSLASAKQGITSLLVASALAFSSQPGVAETASTATQPANAVATVGMIGDLVKGIAGDHATVDVIIGTGVDPHVFKPTRGDLLRLEKADMIFYQGLNLEGAMAHVLQRLADEPNRKVLAVGEAVRLSGKYEIETEEDGEFDPHIWMDVQGWKQAAQAIADTKSQWNPEKAETFRANLKELNTKLDALDQYVREIIASIPEQKRYLITAHDAFGYFGRAYGMEVRGIQGISTESEAGLRDIEETVNFLVENQIPAVFVETSVPDRNVRALIEGAKAKGHEVVIGGELFSDAMGPAGTYEGTYVGMIDHNASTIARALGGQVPEGGFQEWLSQKE